MPLHTHDCDACVYLGSLNGTDHYFCPRDKSLIQRFGSNGWEYLHGPWQTSLCFPHSWLRAGSSPWRSSRIVLPEMGGMHFGRPCRMFGHFVAGVCQGTALGCAVAGSTPGRSLGKPLCCNPCQGFRLILAQGV